ncbi:hypothetical protein BDW02DRAFT_569857, partial [Decorospora gaudefroyi]
MLDEWPRPPRVSLAPSSLRTLHIATSTPSFAARTTTTTSLVTDLTPRPHQDPPEPTRGTSCSIPTFTRQQLLAAAVNRRCCASMALRSLLNWIFVFRLRPYRTSGCTCREFCTRWHWLACWVRRISPSTCRCTPPRHRSPPQCNPRNTIVTIGEGSSPPAELTSSPTITGFVPTRSRPLHGLPILLSPNQIPSPVGRTTISGPPSGSPCEHFRIRVAGWQAHKGREILLVDYGSLFLLPQINTKQLHTIVILHNIGKVPLQAFVTKEMDIAMLIGVDQPQRLR